MIGIDRYLYPRPDARLCCFLQQLQADLRRPASVAKIIRFAATPNHPYNARHPVPRRGALAIVTNVGAGCGGRGSVRRERCLQAVIRERAPRADERRLNAFASVGRHSAGWSFWRRKLRTAKPCGSGARGWRQAGEGLQSSTGQCEPSIRRRWRQEEFVSRESTV
jgi:hypothetical protein